MINEKALAKQLINPGNLPCCILHALMRMCEKLIQQLLLCGLRKNQRGKAFMDYCARVEATINEKVLARSEINMTTGQWQFPPDKKDQKKLGDVKLI